MKEAGIRLLLSMMQEANDMEKEFRVNMVRSGRPDGLVLLLRAASLKSAVKNCATPNHSNCRRLNITFTKRAAISTVFPSH